VGVEGRPTFAHLIRHPAGASGATGTVVAPATVPTMVLVANPYASDTPVMAEASYEMTTKYSVVCTDPEPVSHA
jgi:hypothetical protein